MLDSQDTPPSFRGGCVILITVLIVFCRFRMSPADQRSVPQKRPGLLAGRFYGTLHETRFAQAAIRVHRGN